MKAGKYSVFSQIVLCHLKIMVYTNLRKGALRFIPYHITKLCVPQFPLLENGGDDSSL